MSFVTGTYGGKTVTFANEQMRKDFAAAYQEMRNYFPVTVTSSYRTEEENKAAQAKHGFSGTSLHTSARALDLTFGVQAFSKSGESTPTPEGLERAEVMAKILGQYNFKWAGAADIVHFAYVGPGGDTTPGEATILSGAQSSAALDGKRYEGRDHKKPFFTTLGYESQKFEALATICTKDPINQKAVFKERLYRIASSHKNASGMHKFVSEGRKLQQEVNATNKII